jgi:hypothetical protein
MNDAKMDGGGSSQSDGKLRTLISLQHGHQCVTLSTPGASSLLNPGAAAEADREAGLLLGPGQLLELAPLRVWCSAELRIALCSGDGQAILFELWFREDGEEGERDLSSAAALGAEWPPDLRAVGADGGGAGSSRSGRGRTSVGDAVGVGAVGVRFLSFEFGSELCVRSLRLPRPGWCTLFLDHRGAWFHTATAHLALTVTPARTAHPAEPPAGGADSVGALRLYVGEAGRAASQAEEERRLQVEFDQRLQVGRGSLRGVLGQGFRRGWERMGARLACGGREGAVHNLSTAPCPSSHSSPPQGVPRSRIAPQPSTAIRTRSLRVSRGAGYTPNKAYGRAAWFGATGG